MCDVRVHCIKIKIEKDEAKINKFEIDGRDSFHAQHKTKHIRLRLKIVMDDTSNKQIE